MYRDEILDHYKNPRNTGTLEEAVTEEGENPSCGDSCRVHLKLEDKHVEKMKHETDGCAVSTAAASILSKEVKGMETRKLRELDREWMMEKLGIEVSPMRVKCAMLPLKTVQSTLEDK